MAAIRKRSRSRGARRSPYQRPARSPSRTRSGTLPSGEAPLSRGQRFQRSAERRNGNPHDAGYHDEVRADPDPGEWSKAATANGKPSLLRCIWRGMYNVRGNLGGAAKDGGLHSRSLSDVLYRYTAEGPRSIYKHVNNTLGRKLQGEQPRKGSGLYFYTVKLVSAVRLLYDGSADTSKVYRGVSRKKVDVAFYEQAKRDGEQVQWNAFTSTSRSREVALRFAKREGDGGVLFVIARRHAHAAAADVSSVSQFPDEQEVLLLPMQVFDVVDVRDCGTHTEIELREVAQYPVEL